MPGERILVVDDEEGVRKSLEQLLEYEGYRVTLAGDGESAIDAFEQEEPDLVLLDVKLPGIDGIQVLGRLKETVGENVAVVMVSGHGTIGTAVESLKKGAFDFLEKPLDENRVLITVENALSAVKLIRENRDLRTDVDRKYRIVGSSAAIREVIEMAEKVAATNARVLITGEHGTGKELVARYIHRMSRKSNGPFIELNCAAIPRELVESELFGHEKGAFTGAMTARKGKFELADGGTLFLDEIGDMELPAQSKVLKAIETGTVTRLGGQKELEVDVRILSASNKDLQEEIRKGTFREDLFYRLNVVQISVPPLRERREDIPELVRAFLEGYALENGIRAPAVEDGAMEFLKGRSWTGNIRELRNVVERMAILSTGEVITREDVEADFEAGRHEAPAADYSFDSFQEFREGTEQEFLKRKLEENDWNVSETARKLGMQRSNLYKKIEKYGLKRSSGDDSRGGNS